MKPIDRLLDLTLTVKAFPRNKADEYNISWVVSSLSYRFLSMLLPILRHRFILLRFVVIKLSFERLPSYRVVVLASLLA